MGPADARQIHVLQQMTQFVLAYPERLRERTEEQKDVEQVTWVRRLHFARPTLADAVQRIEPCGWDSQDRTYYILDDNRVYRLSPAPPPAPKPKKNSKKARAARNKRRRVSEAEEADTTLDDAETAEPVDDDLGGMKWECVVATLDDARHLIDGLKKTRDANEKVLLEQVKEHVLPILEKQEEARKRKELQREKELLNLQKLAHAKRSSRIASRVSHQQEEEQRREEEMRRQREEAAARKEEQKRLERERERDDRLMSRARRLREREERRAQHEEELAQLSSDSKSVGRMSERRVQAEMAKKKQALKELEQEEDDWIFDCVCGAYGQIDDGTHSVSCERCHVWQHSKCLGVSEEDAEQDKFHFVCDPCQRYGQAGKKKITLKVHGKTVEADAKPNNGVHPAPSSSNGGPPAVTPTTACLPSPVLQSGNPFSSPHPQLSPPDLSPNKSKAYKSIFVSSPTTTAAATTAPPPPPSVGTKKVPPPAPPVLTLATPGPPQLQTPSGTSRTDGLPSTRGGLSPTKHSPAVPPQLSFQGACVGDGASAVAPLPSLNEGSNRVTSPVKPAGASEV